jgi:hypothetical protein
VGNRAVLHFKTPSAQTVLAGDLRDMELDPYRLSPECGEDNTANGGGESANQGQGDALQSSLNPCFQLLRVARSLDT